MGWGDFGSNGSVHWSIGYEDDTPKDIPDHVDYDDDVQHPRNPKPDGRPVIGQSGRKDHPGRFRVTLRFKDNTDLANALKALNSAGQSGREMVIDVPVHDYRSTPPPRNQWEIKVEW